MLDPKEQAEKLIAEYKAATSYNYQEYAGASSSLFEHDSVVIKECILIAVKYLICATQYECDLQSEFHPIETTEYWLAVKREVELIK